MHMRWCCQKVDGSTEAYTCSCVQLQGTAARHRGRPFGLFGNKVLEPCRLGSAQHNHDSLIGNGTKKKTTAYLPHVHGCLTYCAVLWLTVYSCRLAGRLFSSLLALIYLYQKVETTSAEWPNDVHRTGKPQLYLEHVGASKHPRALLPFAQAQNTLQDYTHSGIIHATNSVP
jgi:hypothetical protein